MFRGIMAQLKIISWNTQGLNSAIKRSLVFQYLQKAAPHICILLETHLTGSRVRAFVKVLDWVSLPFHLLVLCPWSQYTR